METVQKVRTLVGRGQLEKAIDFLSQTVSNRVFLNQIIHQKGRLYELKQQIRMKTIDDNAAEANRNQISVSLLEIIDQIEHAGSNLEEPNVTTDPNALVGRITNFRVNEEFISFNKSIQVWNFMVDRIDEKGQPLSPVPVEMRARSFSGMLNEGNLVQIDKKWQPGKVLRVSKVKLVDTGTYVKERSNFIQRFAHNTWSNFYVFIVLAIIAALYGVIQLLGLG